MAFCNRIGSFVKQTFSQNITVNCQVPLLNAIRRMSTGVLTIGGGGMSRGNNCNLPEKRNIQDHKRRLLAAKYELRRKLYKAFCKDPDLPGEMRDKLRYKLSKLPRNSSFTRVRNRCVVTGRPRAVYQFCRMSRITFRELALKGELMGIKKASW